MATTTTVSAERAGETLAAVVREALDLPWSKAKAMCASGRVRVDGDKVVDPARRVTAGARVEIDPEAPRERRGVLARDRILHLDADVVVVRKPTSTLTCPFHDDDRDTLSDQTRAALRRLEARRRGGRDPMVGVVQRLDKDTTGVLVFARTPHAKKTLEEQLRAHTVGRRYLGIAHGVVHGRTYVSFIVRDRGDGLRGSLRDEPREVPRDARSRTPEEGKRSVTHITVKEALRGATFVECRLETGRQHQIRIHLSEAGHPLVGETVYIRDFHGTRIAAPRPMLHAVELAFEHPRTGERMTFTEEPPDDFRAVLERLQRRSG